MVYGDARRRGSVRGASNFRNNVMGDPRFSIRLGLGTGLPILLVSFLLSLDPFPAAAILPAIPSAALFFRGVRRLRREESRSTPKLGAEKQLLLALRESGGLTAVEAALETSLTVDEAEGMLSSLAERGHLLIENRGGALSYALPGRSPGPLA